MPIAELTKQMPGTAWFVRPLGVVEVLGAIGVTLPWLLGIQPHLTPLAAAGLVIIMIGATVRQAGRKRPRADPGGRWAACGVRRLWPLAAHAAASELTGVSTKRRLCE